MLLPAFALNQKLPLRRLFFHSFLHQTTIARVPMKFDITNHDHLHRSSNLQLEAASANESLSGTLHIDFRWEPRTSCLIKECPGITLAMNLEKNKGVLPMTIKRTPCAIRAC